MHIDLAHTTTSRALAVALVVAGITAATLAVGAQTAPGPGAPRSDADFVRLLDRSNTAELDAAKYVVNRTKDPAVHQFAQRMIDDHSTAAVKLEAATRGTNLLPVPRADAQPPAGEMRGMTRLTQETGPQMDADYMRMQIGAHRRALEIVQWEAQNGQNAGLRALATSLAPTIQQHLQLAEAYLSSHGLTPYMAPPPNPVPGNPNPGNRGAGGPGGPPNNPATAPNGGSTTGEGNASGGTQPNTAPVTGPTYQPLGSGTPPPGAGPTNAPAPAPSASPHG